MSESGQFSLLTQRRFLPFFVVQALSALNDNIYRQAIIAFLFYLGIGNQQRTLYVQLAPILFILPYFLLSSLAGQIAERLPKHRLILMTTSLEIGIMSLAAIGFLMKAVPLLLVALVGTGILATLFGPVKYAILPAILQPQELTGGNALVESMTSLAILCGMIIGGIIFDIAGGHGPFIAAVTVVLLAILGHLVARYIPKVPASQLNLPINWNPITASLDILSRTHRCVAVRHAVLGVSWFWFIGTLLTTLLPDYATLVLGGQGTALYVLTLALFSIGTGIGALCCETLSGRRVEIGLVPLGAFGVSLFLADLCWQKSTLATVTELTIIGFWHQPASGHVMIDFIGIGASTGFFVVPLYALIQQRGPRQEIARMIAALNLQNALLIAAAASTGLVLRTWLHWTIPQIFLALAIVNVCVAAWICYLVPADLLRFFCSILIKILYRLRADQVAALIPTEGAAVLVCNHVSYLDTLLLSAVVPRPIRFVMNVKMYDLPVLTWFFRCTKAIPMASACEDRRLMQQGFDQIATALADGELIGIFPEGGLTGDGAIAPFQTEVEHILARSPVPVIPLALRGMWTSLWSRRHANLGQWRLPRRFRAPVEVVAAPALAGEQVTAQILEDCVRDLRGSAIP